MSREKYNPSSEEIKRAEGMMSGNDWKMSVKREKVIEELAEPSWMQDLDIKEARKNGISEDK